MRVFKWFLAVAAVGLIGGPAAFAADVPAAPSRPARPAREMQLTPDQRAALQQLRDLHKQVRIEQLEAELARLKGEPQGVVSGHQDRARELRTQLRGLLAKHPRLAEMARRRMLHARAWRFRPGSGPGVQGMGWGRRGQGVGPQMGGERMRMRARHQMAAPDRTQTPGGSTPDWQQGEQ